MKIAITTVQVPFVTGGAEFLVKNLKNALINHGHEAEIITLPLVEWPPHMIENCIVAARLLDLEYTAAGKIDLCIGTKFPAYCIPHPNKVIWAMHQHRTAYDLYHTKLSAMRLTPEGRALQKVINRADNQYLPEAKRIYTIAENVSKRMRKFNNIESTPLYHPCPDMDNFYCCEYEDYILMPSRINPTKRQMLALEALCLTKSNFKLYFVGKADNEVDEKEFFDFIKSRKLEDRVRCFGFVTQEEKLRLYANAKAVLFIPIDEDYGYITLEAMASSKAVITAIDSGGPLEFVQDELSGEVVEPTAIELAHAMDYLMTSKYAAIEMGRQGKRRLKEMNITWDNVVKELTKS